MTDTAFTCPQCGRTSHHPDDARHGYCGACHASVDDAPSLMEARDVGAEASRVRIEHLETLLTVTREERDAENRERGRALRERDEARRLARHLAIRLGVLRRGDFQGPERAMCEFAIRYPEEPDVNAPAPWMPGGTKDTP